MGFDTINFKLEPGEAGSIDFLAETPCFLCDVSEHKFGDGNVALTGFLNGENNNRYKVSVMERQVTIKDCSLSKWYLGNNVSELDRRDTKEAINKLSDLLHLPICKANVVRLDFAVNILTKYPPDVYLTHLGSLRYYSRLQQPTAIYYNQETEKFVLYDKLKEQKKAGAFISELYENSNVLRIEQRYIKRVASRFGSVDGSMLYDENFYNMLLNRWKDTYLAINKINDVSINLKVMTTKKDLYKMGVLSLIEKAGGETEMLNQIKERQLMGDLTRKQASDLKKAVIEAGKIDSKIIVPNSAVSELDEKVKRAVKFFR